MGEYAINAYLWDAWDEYNKGGWVPFIVEKDPSKPITHRCGIWEEPKIQWQFAKRMNMQKTNGCGTLMRSYIDSIC